MSAIATAIVGGSIIGGAMNGSAARQAGSMQADSADRATAATQAQFEQTRKDNMPWHDAGVGALGQMTTGIQPGAEFNRDFTMADFNADPGMQFRMQQGRDAVEGSAAARGGLLSGGTLKALTDYGQNQGSQEYGNAYARFNNNMTTRFNRLASVSGIGQTATANTNQMGANATESMNQTRMAGANANASSVMGNSNGIVSGINNGVNGYMSLNMLNRFQPTAPGVPATPAYPPQSVGSPTMIA